MYYKSGHREKGVLGYIRKNTSLVSGLSALALIALFVSTAIISGQSGQLSNLTGSFAASGFSATNPTCSAVTITTGTNPTRGLFKVQVFKGTTSVAVSPEFSFLDGDTERYVTAKTIAFSPALTENTAYQFRLTKAGANVALGNNTFNGQCGPRTYNITVETVCRSGSGYVRKYKSASHNAYHAVFAAAEPTNYNILTDRNNGVYDNFPNRRDNGAPLRYRIESRYVVTAGNHVPMQIIPKPGAALPANFTVDAARGNVSWERSTTPSGNYAYYALLPDSECPTPVTPSPAPKSYNITVETVCRSGNSYVRKYKSASHNAYHAIFAGTESTNYNILTDQKNGVYDSFANRRDNGAPLRYRIESRYVVAAGNHVPMQIIQKPGAALPANFTVDATRGNVSWERSTTPSGNYAYYALLPASECPVSFNITQPTCSGVVVDASQVTDRTGYFRLDVKRGTTKVAASSTFTFFNALNNSYTPTKGVSFSPPLNSNETFTFVLVKDEVPQPLSNASYAARCAGTVPVTPTPTPTTTPVACTNKDIMMVMDTSGSMSGSEIADAKSAVSALVGRLPSNAGVRAGVVGFGTRSYDVAGLSANLANISSAVNALNASGGTNIAGGISLGASKMSADNRTHIILLFTDGVANVPRDSGVGPNDPAAYATAQAAATAAVQAEIARGLRPVFYSVGLGSRSQLNSTWLDALTSGTGGRSAYVSKSGDLENLFASLSTDICRETPSNTSPTFLNNIQPPLR